MENKIILDKKYLFSKWISYICEAPFLAIPAFIIINLTFDMDNFLLIEGVSFLFTTIIPILVILIHGKIKNVDIDHTIRETRNYPLLIATFMYLLGAFIL